MLFREIDKNLVGARAFNAIRHDDYDITVQRVAGLSDAELLRVPGLGKDALKKLRDGLATLGFCHYQQSISHWGIFPTPERPSRVWSSRCEILN